MADLHGMAWGRMVDDFCWLDDDEPEGRAKKRSGLIDERTRRGLGWGDG